MMTVQYTSTHRIIAWSRHRWPVGSMGGFALSRDLQGCGTALQQLCTPTTETGHMPHRNRPHRMSTSDKDLINLLHAYHAASHTRHRPSFTRVNRRAAHQTFFPPLSLFIGLSCRVLRIALHHRILVTSAALSSRPTSRFHGISTA